MILRQDATFSAAPIFRIFFDGFNDGKKQEKIEIAKNLLKQNVDINIISVSENTDRIKNIVFEITDKKLIEKANGIVQGMSGSPIIQNGKLIGAVTHVLVDDSTKGYGIFAENMLETAQQVTDDQELKDAS